MERIAGLDYGLVRIGVALSDVRRLIASPLGTVSTGKTLEESVKNVLQILSPYVPLKQIVVGLPLLLNGKDSPMTKMVREFAKSLESALGLPVILWDERLTTAQVEKTLRESDMNRKKRSKIIDTLTAAVILQNYLDAHPAHEPFPL